MSKNTSLRIKLCRQLLKFGSVETDKGTLMYEGDLVLGTEVFVEDENGEVVPAENGNYLTRDEENPQVITVEDGKVTAIESMPKAIEETPIDEAMEETVEETPTEGAPTVNYDEMILGMANEMDMMRAEIESLRSDVEFMREEISSVKRSLTSESIEESFSKETKKPVWDKF